MAAARVLGFSPKSEYFAYSSPDGVLKLWEPTSGVLKQEYTPSSHLSTTCTCLSWSPQSQTQSHNETPKKKKRKSDGASNDGKSSNTTGLLALGTTSGSILLYDVLKGDIHTQLDEGHSKKVTCICWKDNGKELFSSSTDDHIVHWDIKTGTIIHKWKADTKAVHAISLCPTGRHLLSAGRSIQLWDLEKKKIIMRFTGHASEVNRLVCISGSSSSATASADHFNFYFVSGAVGDRHLNLWHANSHEKHKKHASKKNEIAVASFSLMDGPLYTCLYQKSAEEAVILAVVTVSGQLHVFEHVLNGITSKPLKPKINLQIASEGVEANPISVLGAFIERRNKHLSLTVAYGSYLFLAFETLRYQDLDSSACLVRKDPGRTGVTAEAEVSKVKTPDVSQEVKTLAPGHMVPQGPSRNESHAKVKRKKSNSTEMSLGEMVHAISLDKPTTKTEGLPKADNMAVLLAQGLQSKDKKILNHTLQVHDEAVIRNTVKRLPVLVLVPFLKELTKRMHGHAQSGKNIVNWIKAVLTLHASYLMTLPELMGTLSGMYEMMDSRIGTLTRLSKLQGKLDLLLSQESQDGMEDDVIPDQQAMLVYQDDSSDEDLQDVGSQIGDSDSEWDEEEESDMDDGSDEESSDEEDDPDVEMVSSDSSD